jgi:hypothetical protein
MNITPGISERKGKQREEPIQIQTPFPDDLSSPTKFDSSENRAFWKLLMRRREQGSRKASVRIIQDPSPDVVEVYAARGFQVSFSYHVHILVLTYRETIEKYRIQAET